MIYTTTLAQLRKQGACISGYNKLVRHLQAKPFTNEDRKRESYIRFAHKDLITLATILESNGIEDAIWSLCAVDHPDIHRQARLFAVWCARQVVHLNTDSRVANCIDVAERYANGLVTDEDRDAAWAAAWAAAGDAARDAARAAAWAAAWDAARAAAWAAAGDAARAAAWAAAGDAAWDAAWAAAGDAAGDAAWAAAGAAQAEQFKIMFCGEGI